MPTPGSFKFIDLEIMRLHSTQNKFKFYETN